MAVYMVCQAHWHFETKGVRKNGVHFGMWCVTVEGGDETTGKWTVVCPPKHKAETLHDEDLRSRRGTLSVDLPTVAQALLHP